MWTSLKCPSLEDSEGSDKHEVGWTWLSEIHIPALQLLAVHCRTNPFTLKFLISLLSKWSMYILDRNQ